MVDRELFRGTPEVHVAGVCLRRSRDGRTEILVVRRGDSRSLYPGMLSGVGGQVLRGESFEEACIRHHSEELGLTVGVHQEACIYRIHVPGEPTIPGVRLLCEATTSHVTPRPGEAAWFATVGEFLRLEESKFIPGVREQTLTLLDRFR